LPRRPTTRYRSSRMVPGSKHVIDRAVGGEPAAAGEDRLDRAAEPLFGRLTGRRRMRPARRVASIRWTQSGSRRARAVAGQTAPLVGGEPHDGHQVPGSRGDLAVPAGRPGVAGGADGRDAQRRGRRQAEAGPVPRTRTVNPEP
jgi:hypothetical protein